MAKTAYEQLMDLLDTDTKAKVQAKLVENPKLIAEDKFTTELFGIYKGVGDEDTTVAASTPEPVAAAHTPALPSAAAVTATPVAATPVSTTAVSGDSAAILSALNSLRTSIDDRFKNVVTMDKVNELGANLINQASTQALRQADEIFTIRDTHRQEFGEAFDRTAFEQFVTAATDPVTKRNKYPTLTDAYNAMVGEKRVKAEIAKGIAEGKKQFLSGATVPGQTTSAALSPAQQVIAKAKSESSGGGGNRLQDLVKRATEIDNANRNSAVN